MQHCNTETPVEKQLVGTAMQKKTLLFQGAKAGAQLISKKSLMIGSVVGLGLFAANKLLVKDTTPSPFAGGRAVIRIRDGRATLGIKY
jgi:hypothetical protein